MKARQLLSLPLFMTLLLILGGCSGAKHTSRTVVKFADEVPPRADETIKEVVAILRGTGDEALVHQDEAALEATIRKLAHTSNGIKSVDDLPRRVPMKEILQAAQRKRFLKDKIGGKLTEIAKKVQASEPIDFGIAVVETHCSGLKHELATGEPASAQDYIMYLVLELVKNRIPKPSSQEIVEVAENLVMVANGLYASTRKDEAARLAYIKDMCKIP